ncbi:HIT domain-containing protein [Candidatus Woesearchaeota archaeon]|nr:HIT domain-containing protein [Candidatus Woesearchaeota archaeon]
MALTAEKIEEIKKKLISTSPEKQQEKLQEIVANLTEDEIADLQKALSGSQCPFCSMVEGQIPVKKVYEDAQVMAILDINPANKGHTLVFPKNHASIMSQLDDKTINHLFKIVNKISIALFESLGVEGTNILIANGKAAGQTSPHVLVNVIPRSKGDQVSIGWEPMKISEKEMSEIQQKIIHKTKEIKSTDEVPVIRSSCPSDEVKVIKTRKRIPTGNFF